MDIYSTFSSYNIFMTIYALSSGIGVAGVAVVRISGPDTKNVVTQLISGRFPEPRVATLKKVNNSNKTELIDEGIIIWYPAPNSYTGEDMAEIQVHGSRAVIKALLDTISNFKKCRMAEPGEFTKLALKNGKINLLKAESIGDLISSETDLQMKQALKVIAGNNLKKFETWREDVLKILSNIEAKIDFPDEDLPKEILNGIKKKSDKIIYEMEASLQDNKVGQIIRDGFKIAIIGPPNVGKSSLLNYLSNRDVAIVSEIAGTTRDVIETHLNINGYPVIISDTAGIRDANDEIEKKGIKLSLKKADESDLNIIIIEAKSKENSAFLDKYINEKTLLVVNKIDKESDIIPSDLKELNPILISIKNQKNIDVLINLIKDKIKSRFLGSENVLITRERHRENLEDCLKNLKNFKNKNDINDFDKAAEDLRLATRSLGKITGKVDVEEILDSIFNDFCIGK